MKSISKQLLFIFIIPCVLTLLASCDNGASLLTKPISAPVSSSNIVATAGDKDGELSLRWNKVAGAVSYTINYSSNSVTKKTSVPDITQESYDFKGLQSGVTYYFTVIAVNEVGTSPEGSQLKYYLRTINFTSLPGVPTSLLATPGSVDGSLTLSWNEGKYANSYTITRTPTSSTYAASLVTEDVDTTQYALADLDTGVTYKFTVISVNSVGSSADSALLSHKLAPITISRLPGFPTNLSVVPGNVNGSLSLRWSGKSNADSYRVKRKPTSSSDPSEVVTTGINTTQQDLTGLDTGILYTFTIISVNSFGESGASIVSHQLDPITTIPLPGIPTNLSATLQSVNGSLVLNWSAAADADSYTIKRTPTSRNDSSETVTAGVTVTQQVVTGLDTGVLYTFTVTSVNSAGSSTESTISHQLPPIVTGPSIPSAPTQLVATPGSVAGSLTISWDVAAEATSYTIKRKPTSNSEPSETITTGITAVQYVFTALDTGVLYTFTVTSVNSAGSSTESIISHQLPPIVTGPSIPSAPTQLVATPGSVAGSLTISWDVAAEATSYTLKQTPTSSSDSSEIVTTGITTPQHALIGLDTGLNGIKYTFTVISVNSAGSSTGSTVSHQLLPIVTAPPIPNAPTQLVATPGSVAGSLTISWDVAAEATSYTLKQTPTSSSDSSEIVTTGITTPQHALIGLDTGLNGIKYTFTVTSVNSTGSSAPSQGLLYLLQPIFNISSTSFTDGGTIKTSMARVSHGGTNTSPQISWINAPIDTKGFAIIFDDETSPCGTQTNACKHWSQTVPGSQTSIAEGAAVALGPMQYTGPWPPGGGGAHTYTLEVFALNAEVTISAATNRAEFELVHGDKILKSAAMTGTFAPPSFGSGPSPGPGLDPGLLPQFPPASNAPVTP